MYISGFVRSDTGTPNPLTSLSDLNQVDQILGDEPEVKERLFGALKQYAGEKKFEWLASVLPDILTTEEHRQLISSIRYHVHVLCKFPQATSHIVTLHMLLLVSQVVVFESQRK